MLLLAAMMCASSAKEVCTLAITEPIRSKRLIRQISENFIRDGKLRDNALFVLGTYTAMRISDLLALKWEQVYSDADARFYTHITIREGKTGKLRTVAVNSHALEALKALLPLRKGVYVFSHGRTREKPICRAQAWRIIRAAAEKAGAEGNISCHSLRKTWGYHAWQDQNVSPVVIMQVYNHSSFEVTKRYLGVEQDELDQVYLSMNLEE